MYVAGRFSAPDQWQRAKNVRAAESLAFAVAEAGAMPLNPLANTANFFGTLSEETLWYPGTLELMRRCDAMILVPGWEGSRGVAAEIAEAKRINMPVFERVEDLKKWLGEYDGAVLVSSCKCKPKLVNCPKCRTGAFDPRHIKETT